MAGKKKSKQVARAKKKPTQAEQADRHALYEVSVQSPEADCELFERIYGELSGGEPKVLREDFCGTAKLSRTWTLGKRGRRAIAIDLDGPTLEQARRRNVEPYAKQLGKRLELVQADVLEIEPGSVAPADVVAALNFSFCVFKQREQLERYLANAYGGLADKGLMILEIFGGTKAIDTDEELRELDGFTYHWEQEWFNPLTNEILCHIHFEFPDGSKLEKAFTYDWRLWSVPELRDLLLEVGFRDVKIYWEKIEGEDEADEDEAEEEEDEDEADEDEEDADEADADEEDEDDGMLRGTGEYVQREVAEQQDSWLVYVVGIR